MKTALLLGICALAASADDARLNGPVPGYVFDRSSQSIRPILGVPGSSYLGPAVAGGFDVASVSPLGVSALATQGGKLYLLRNLDRDQPDTTSLDGAISAVGRFAWSPDGLSAAVYSADSGQAQVLRNLDPRDGSKTTSLEDPIDLSSLDGVIASLAFDGKRLLIGAASPNSGGVYLIDDASAPKLLARAANPAALAVDAAKGDLYISDQDNNQIWTIRDYAGDATPALFVDGRAGLSSPLGIRVGAAGRQLLVANSGSRSIDAIEISTRAPLQHMDLDFAPSRLEPLGSGPLSLLTLAGDNGPLYVLDSSGDLAVYFVPAGGSQ